MNEQNNFPIFQYFNKCVWSKNVIRCGIISPEPCMVFIHNFKSFKKYFQSSVDDWGEKFTLTTYLYDRSRLDCQSVYNGRIMPFNQVSGTVQESNIILKYIYIQY